MFGSRRLPPFWQNLGEQIASVDTGDKIAILYRVSVYLFHISPPSSLLGMCSWCRGTDTLPHSDRTNTCYSCYAQC